jgi:hypothetical protein
MIWLPEHGVGAVILTNGDSGVYLRGPLLRRLLEVLFDGKPEAEETLKVAAAQRKAAIAKERERLVVPADPAAVTKLAPRYASEALGEVKVLKEGHATVFDVGEWKSTVAPEERRRDDLVHHDRSDARRIQFTSRQGRKRRLITRDAQREYWSQRAPRSPSAW